MKYINLRIEFFLDYGAQLLKKCHNESFFILCLPVASRIYWYFVSEHKNEKVNLKYNLLENWKSDLKNKLAGNTLGFLSHFILSLIKGLTL